MNIKQFLAIAFVVSNLNFTVSAHIFEDLSLWWKGKEEEVISHEHTLTPHAHISIENIYGDITISTWKQSKVMLEATKIGSEASVKNTKIDLTYTKNGLSIKTVNLNPNEICKIAFSIIVPSDAVLDSVKTDAGNIVIKNVITPLALTSNYGDITVQEAQHSVNVYTKNGSITISTLPTLTADNRIVAFTEKGTITLQVPEESNAHVCATTLRGHVSSEQPITLDPRTIKISTKTLAQLKRDVQGSLGDGKGPNVKLHTNKGNIKLVVS